MSEKQEEIISPIVAAATEYPAAVGLAGDKKWSYAAMAGQIERYLTFFRDCNFVAGDRVLLIASPSEEYCLLLWSLFHASMMACPVNPAFPGNILKHLIDLLQPVCVLYDLSAEHLVEGLAVRCIPISDLPLIEENGGNGFPPAEMNRDAQVTAICTSGSSGMPKVAVHTLGNHLYAADRANANLPLVPGDIWLLSLPLYHVSGMSLLFRCALAGATLALPEPDVALEEALRRVGATHVSLVPTQLSRLLASDRGKSALRDMKGVLIGGAASNDALMKQAWEAKVPLFRSYGMTETAAQLCATPSGASLEDLYSSGWPFEPDTLRIAEDGVIEVRGATVFPGYFQCGGGVIRPETEDGWFRTGDRGCFDVVGRLHVLGRMDSMFVSGGENIYPEEIENALEKLPEVGEAAVVDVPDPEYGAVPVAFIRWTGADPLGDSALRALLLSELPRYKIPRMFLTWPKNMPGGIKPDRSRLRTEAIKQAGVDGH